MKTQRNILRAIIDSSFLWIVGAILIVWGLYANNWQLIGLSLLVICLGMTTSVKNYKLDVEIDTWLRENDGKLIFFYATKKKKQERIRSSILPMLDESVLQAYYDGSKIVGDLEGINHLLRRIMSCNPKIRPHNPLIMRIENGVFIIKDELKLLMETDIKIDERNMRKRLEKACS